MLFSERKDYPSELRTEIKAIMESFKRNQYRDSLLSQSESFKPEKERLHSLASTSPKQYPQLDEELRTLLKECLNIQSVK